jgi:hypothetical protein
MSAIVPDVTGLSDAAAEAELIDAGLILGDTTNAYSHTVAEDVVINQDPVADTEVEDGSAVDLVVSLGVLAPTGVLGQVVDGIRRCVAASTTFRTAVNVSTEADAMAYIHAWRMDESVEPPFAFVAPAEETRERISTAGPYPERGGVLLALVLPVVQSDDLFAFYDFDNKRDAIITEIVAAAMGSGYAHIRRIELDAENYGLWSKREQRARGAEAIQAWHEITWGF